jgi:putative flippase GtrA
MRITRFATVGAFCAVLTNVAIILLVRAGLGNVTATVVTFVPVLLLGYALHAAFTFRRARSGVSFGRYTLAMAANFPLTVGAIYLLCDVLRIPVAIGAPATTLLIFLWNYVAGSWAFSAAPPRAQAQPVESARRG